MKGIFINVDSYNSEGITTIQGNNNAEIYKICISKRKVRLSLVGKTVKLGYVMAGTTKGDIIEDLNISNAEQGEITLPITNKISKKDGVYTCQLAIYGADGFLEYTATFGLTVQSNIFTKIAGEIADSKDFTYLENILDKASKLSEKLKENTSSATNANSNLESNIIEANNINSKLLENTSTATGLNKNLESNITLAEGVKETIKDLDTKNIEATSKIERLEGLNTKAEELSDNINKGLPLNSELVKNTEEAKAANTNLLEANQEATTKNTELQASLEKTKEFIDGLDRSQNIPQLRLDVTELQNGLKSNQALSYEGSSIAANNTLEGRTEGMRIGGRTLVNLKGNVKNRVSTWVDNDDKYTLNLESGHGQPSILYNLTHVLKENQKYTVIVNLVEYTSGVLHFSFMNSEGNKLASTTELVAESKGLKKFVFTTNSTINAETLRILPRNGINNIYSISKNILILEGDWTNKDVPSYFEGIESFGEQEGNKISILSHSENLFDYKTMYSTDWVDGEGKIINSADGKHYSVKVPIYKTGVKYYIYGKGKNRNNIAYLDEHGNVISFSRPSLTNPIELDIAPPNAKTILAYLSSDGFNINENNELVVSLNNITTYKPYQEPNKKDILIKEPLRSVGDVCDVLYEDNGQVKVNRLIGRYIFTGNENFVQLDNNNNSLSMYVDINTLNILLNGTALSNNFNYLAPNNLVNMYNDGISISGSVKNRFLFRISTSKLPSPDVSGFKAWLKANPTTIVYQLATPVLEIVENCVDIDLDTYQEKTYFNILNSLPGTLDFKVPSNIGSVVQNMAKEVNNIWDVINNLLVPSIVKANGNLAMLKLNNNLN